MVSNRQELPQFKVPKTQPKPHKHQSPTKTTTISGSLSLSHANFPLLALNLQQMGDPKPPPPPPPSHQTSLVQPSNKKKHKPAKALRVFRSVLRSFPIISPVCKFPSLPGGVLPDTHHRNSSSSSASANRVAGTLFGYQKGRVNLSIQENSRTLPTLVVELAMQTNVLQVCLLMFLGSLMVV